MRILLGFFLLLASFRTSGQIPVFESFNEFQKSHVAVQNDTAYLYNFWATWCKPCVEELPHFISLSEKVAQGPYKIVFVSLDSKKNTEKLSQFVAEKLPNQQVVQLTDNKYNDWLDKVDPSWSGSIPATLLQRGAKKEFHEKQFEDFTDLHNVWLHFINN